MPLKLKKNNKGHAQVKPVLSAILAMLIILILPTAAAAAPIINVQKAANVNATLSGSDIRYDISVKNQGDETAQNIIVSDTLDSRLEFVSSTLTPATNTEVNGQTVLTFNLGNLATSTATTTFSITARTDPDLSPAVVIPNSVSVDGANLVGTVVSGNVNVTVNERQSVLDVTKSVNDIFQSVGEIANYTIRVENVGNFTVNNLVLRDIVDADHQVIALPAGASTTILADGRTEVTLTRASLDPGASFSILVQTRVKTGTPIGAALINDVEVSSSNAETASTFNAALVVGSSSGDNGQGGVGDNNGDSGDVGGIGGNEDGLPRTGIDPTLVLLFALGCGIVLVKAKKLLLI